MTDRATIIENYKQKQKDLASSQERTKAKVNERDAAKVEFEKTEKYVKNLECIA